MTRIPAPPLTLLWGVNTFQTFVDDAETDLYPRIIHGDWPEVYGELMALNDAGAVNVPVYLEA